MLLLLLVLVVVECGCCGCYRCSCCCLLLSLLLSPLYAFHWHHVGSQPFFQAMDEALDSLLAMGLVPPTPDHRLLLRCPMLGVSAPLQMPPWLNIWGEDCAEHVHGHAGIVVLVYMLVAARRSSCAAVCRSRYAAVRRSSRPMF